MKKSERVLGWIERVVVLVVLFLAPFATVQAADKVYGTDSGFALEKSQAAVENDALMGSSAMDEALEDLEKEIKMREQEEKMAARSTLAVDQTGAALRFEEEAEVTHDNWMSDSKSLGRNAPTDKLSRSLKIDQTVKDSKSVRIPSFPKKKKKASLDQGFNDQTAIDIINSLVKPDLLKTKLNLDFGDATLGEVFMTLGKSGKFNIMMDPTIKDLMVEVYLQQVTIKEALILMANAHNLGFKRVESSLFVAPVEKLQNQALGFKIIKLRNIKALEAKVFVTELARVVNVSEQTNSLIVIGNPDEIEKVQKAVKAIDYPQPQVVLEANIVEVNKDALKDLGVDWSDEIAFTYQESGRPFELPNGTDPSKSVLSIGALERTPLTFSTAIKLLENQNKAKVLSNPRVTTMNEKEAEIFVGDRIPYTVNTVSGGATTTEVRFEEPGIRLKITPTIIDGDYVVIKVEPEVSFIFAFRGPDNEFPWVKKRHATAYVRVRNNQPFALGGLLNQEDKKNLFKVPMLGDIPLLGNLFTYERHSVLDTELIITITPAVVHAKQANVN